jgi:hypothetical protein
MVSGCITTAYKPLSGYHYITRRTNILEFISQSIWRLGYGLENRGIGSRFLIETSVLSALHNAEIGSEFYHACYPTVTEGPFSRDKASILPYNFIICANGTQRKRYPSTSTPVHRAAIFDVSSTETVDPNSALFRFVLFLAGRDYRMGGVTVKNQSFCSLRTDSEYKHGEVPDFIEVQKM